MAELASPHDAFFKQFLSRPEIAADFLRSHLPPEVAEALELNALALQKDTFVDSALRLADRARYDNRSGTKRADGSVPT